MKITTNNVPRTLLCHFELPKKWQKEFDYIEGCDWTPRFTKYKGQWIDVIDAQSILLDYGLGRHVGWAMSVKPDHPFAKWDTVISDSFFSGLLFRFNYEDNTVVVGRYCS